MAVMPLSSACPFEAGAQQHPGDGLAGAEHLEVLLPLSSGLWQVGANAVARTRCAPGPQNMQLAAALYLQGLLVAPPLLDLHGLCLPGAAGPQALNQPCSERSSHAAAWLCPGTFKCHPLLCPQGFTQPFCSFIWGALQGGGFALLSLHATRVPSPQHRPWAALGFWASQGPCP